MRRIRSKGMKPEMAVRRVVHGMGYRYRLHATSLPGKPDLAFPSRRKAIFVHGCFWHQHADRRCKITRRPKSNQAYWRPKLQRNVERDARHQAELREQSWEVFVIWECQLDDVVILRRRVREFLGPPGPVK
jgi:DNA mismatch endonuclease, patch repair protein